jgi:DNA-binding transcriptional ArsR family regulator
VEGVVVGEGFEGLSVLRVPQVEIGQVSQAPGRPRAVGGSARSGWIQGRFVRKVPLDWLGRACRLPGGKTLATALGIWFEAGRRRRLHDLKITTRMLEGNFGVARSAKATALRKLEQAGLIRIQRQGRKNPLVTIIAVTPDDGAGAAA